MAEEVVRERYQPGDLIVFAPDWVDPVGRLTIPAGGTRPAVHSQTTMSVENI